MAETDKAFDRELPELGAYPPPPAFAADDDDVFAVSDDEPGLYGPTGTLESAGDEAPASVSPERVRFVVPAVLTFDGYAETFDATVQNLSEQGVACSGPQGLTQHDRLRLRFRLNLAAEPRSFLCEVIWAHNQPGDDNLAHYGLRFLELEAEAGEAVREAVRERVEGRAAEWPMPIVPPPADVSEEVLSPPRANPWLAGAAGLAAGIGLTLLLVALWRAGTDEVTPPDVLASSQIDTPEVRPGAGDAVLPPLEVAPAGPSVEAMPPPPMPPSETVAAAPAKVRKIGLMRVEEGTDALALTLLADGPVAKHQTFWLKNPRRLVLDIDGRNSGFQSKVFEVNHPLVKRVRVGQHPGKVRFVIETGPDVAREVTAQQQGNGVRLELHRPG